VVDILQSKHLLNSEWRAGARWYELTHDSLIRPIRESNQAWYDDCERKSQTIYSSLNRLHGLINEGKNARALEVCDDAITGGTEIGNCLLLADAYSYRGFIIWQCQKDPKNAIDPVLKALSLMRSTGQSERATRLLLDLGNVYREAERFSESIATLTDYIQSVANDPRGYGMRAAAFWYAGQLEDAIADFTVELDFEPESLHAYNGRGQVYAELGACEAAIQDLNKALELAVAKKNDTMRAYALNGRGLAFGGLGKFRDALKDFEASISICPDNAWVYYNRSQVYQWKGDSPKATEDLALALSKQNPRLTPRQVKNAKARMAELKGRSQWTFW
jgi:tetratricopeptide (TPR) repeat protein